MNLNDEILKEHSKRNTVRVAMLAGENENHIKQLISLVTGKDREVARKASWILRHSYDSSPECYSHHLTKLINHLKRKDLHDAVKRNILGILKSSDIPGKSQGDLLEICFNFIESGKESVSVKAFSIRIIAGMGSREPDLLKELKIILENQIPYSSPGFKNLANKILHAKKIKSPDYEI